MGMAQPSIVFSISPTVTTPSNPKFNSSSFKTITTATARPSSSSSSVPLRCRCVNRGWDSIIHDVVSNAITKFDSYLNSLSPSPTAPQQQHSHSDWDWDRWCLHFQEVDDQDRLLSILKSELRGAVYSENYEVAAKLKVAIAAVAPNDPVATVISLLNSAIEEERYNEAAFLRDKAGAGLVGWWAGIPEDVNDQHGLIIRITPEHGRYVARSYSPRQLAKSAAGIPLFEIFLTMNKKGEFRSQAVYLKRRASPSPPTTSSKALDAAERLSSVNSPKDRGELLVVSTEDPESSDDRNDNADPAEEVPGFQNVLKDIIPGVKVKVLKVTTPEKVDKDLTSKVIEQIIEEEEDEDTDEDEDEDEGADVNEDEENDNETERSGEEEDIKSETGDKIEINSSLETFKREQQKEIAVKVAIGGLVQKLSSNLTTKDLLRVPAKLETKGRCSFSFTVEKVVNQRDGHDKGSSSKSTKSQGRRSADHVMFDLAKFIGKGKVPSKVLKEAGELINLTLSQARNHQPLSGSTVFKRIEIPASPEPLNGLYIGSHGLYSSEVIQLKRRFGHWQEDGGAKEPSDLEFYEYVEALKITGDPYVPAGQVAFRAKVGKRYQLPHKGIFPEEFGVIARYKGQGRLAEPGFRNPRWVDGELVILDGKFIKSGPVVGFVYWAPSYHFLVFFNRLRLQQ
ncbi:hypothetical protein RIF29_41575 [Crotalaria pallida]|uniref:Protein EXECUTER 1, chloroplastic n=1 Tax=Crotalaria pallida TaxID=3830 RepID=A0AAN9HPH9_CROPI